MSRASAPSWWASWRRFKDRLATLAISTGGAVVLMTILSLFVFLVYETLPLLRPATLEPQPAQVLRPGSAAPVEWLSSDRYGVVVFTIDGEGEASFISVKDGGLLKRVSLTDPGRELRALAVAGTGESGVALGFDDGSIRIVSSSFAYTFTEDELRVLPALSYPFGRAALRGSATEAVQRLALGAGSDLAAVQFASGALDLLSLKGATASQTHEVISLGLQPAGVALHFLDDDRRLLLLTEEGHYRLWATADGMLLSEGRLFASETPLVGSTLLQGGGSIIAASGRGELVRYLVLADGTLRATRQFDTHGDVMAGLVPEHRRRGFLALGGGSLHWFNATSGVRSLQTSFDVAQFQAVALSPRSDTLLAVDESGRLLRWALDNPHPEVSLSSLWQRVWYEGYQQPEWVYQSSASGNDYEAKLSMTPLAFGTLKAALYAMLFATPLAIGGAIYTAFFMAPALRRRIKPLVELMEALPTVILGFLAGLWLAPLIEENLSEFLAVVLTIPVGVLVFAGLWSRLPLRLRNLVPEGWHAIILLPVIVVLAWVGFALGGPVEGLMFGGDTRRWLSDELGLAYDQRNAMVVGIAMGFAVIPTIFSIAEDAIYSVPRHLAYGSLALGATPWQTLVGVVLPTASPGVFSGLMIGFGRAVGETMIVLMATGNTPIMDANLFEGMRTLAANIAVEVPEAEVGSTHYRILFLAAFVLFLFTFAVNTVAEIVRQRLRARYGALG